MIWIRELVERMIVTHDVSPVRGFQLNDLDVHQQTVYRNAAVPEYIEQALRNEPG